MGHKPITDGGAGPGWMFIFADVLALLLTFFVLLFSMNSLRADGWQAVVSSFTTRLNPSRPHSVHQPEAIAKSPRINQPMALDLTYLSRLIEIRIADNPLLAGAAVRRLGDRLVISLPSDLLFEPGAAELGGRGGPAAAGLGELFANVSNRIAVAGHAQWQPDGDQVFANQWELSLARAIVIARAIRAGGYLRYIAAFGRANADPIPIAGPSWRFARRIDIMVMQAQSQGDGP